MFQYEIKEKTLLQYSFIVYLTIINYFTISLSNVLCFIEIMQPENDSLLKMGLNGKIHINLFQ